MLIFYNPSFPSCFKEKSANTKILVLFPSLLSLLFALLFLFCCSPQKGSQSSSKTQTETRHEDREGFVSLPLNVPSNNSTYRVQEEKRRAEKKGKEKKGKERQDEEDRPTRPPKTNPKVRGTLNVTHPNPPQTSSRARKPYL